MSSYEAKLLRRELLNLKVWIEHFQADAATNLVPTASGLILAKAHAESALTLLDRLEVEQREAA